MNKFKHQVLFVSSEVYPLIKTGGLADVCYGLPVALAELDCDVRLLIPAYLSVKRQLKHQKRIYTFSEKDNIHLIEAVLPKTKIKLWLIDIPTLFERIGGPYTTANGYEWPDNAERFSEFCKWSCQIALDQIGLEWQPDIVHCNDWQTGLIPALLSQEKQRPTTIFTIHNLAYQGLFPQETFDRLNLPSAFWSPEQLEFHDSFSFIKGGIVFSDAINTVSPKYADEIQTPEFGCGLDGLLRHRAGFLSGIINGVDYQQWNPAKDKAIVQTYSAHTISRKQKNKTALQKEFGLPTREDIPVIGTIGRIVEQKGYDLILGSLSEILALDIQMVILGTGDRKLEKALVNAAKLAPEQMAVRIGYDETLAHVIEAGADIFLMPSRFEPCGLNQIYSQRYGTVPIVHDTGGLADTVIDANTRNLSEEKATGFKFSPATSAELSNAVTKAIGLYLKPRKWRKVVRSAMQQDFSWKTSAIRYLELYQQAQKNQRLTSPK